MPRLLRVSAEYVVVLRIQLDIVLVEVIEQVFSAQYLRNLDKLIRVAVAVEKWFSPEDHRCKHGAQRPHVQRVVVFLEIDQQFRSLEVTRSNANVVLSTGVVKLSKTPVDQSQLHSVSTSVAKLGPID
jgi:hypothetical protein